MKICQMMTGSGGWPLTIVLTPEKKPFFAGTYLPKETRHGMHGLLELLPRITILWQEQRSNLPVTVLETNRHEACTCHGGKDTRGNAHGWYLRPDRGRISPVFNRFPLEGA